MKYRAQFNEVRSIVEDYHTLNPEIWQLKILRDFNNSANFRMCQINKSNLIWKIGLDLYTVQEMDIKFNLE